MCEVEGEADHEEPSQWIVFVKFVGITFFAIGRFTTTTTTGILIFSNSLQSFDFIFRSGRRIWVK
jgi:hypothetical protein